MVPNCGEAGPKVAGEWVEVEVLDGNADIVECALDLEVGPMIRATRVNCTGKIARVRVIPLEAYLSMLQSRAVENLRAWMTLRSGNPNLRVQAIVV